MTDFKDHKGNSLKQGDQVLVYCRTHQGFIKEGVVLGPARDPMDFPHPDIELKNGEVSAFGPGWVKKKVLNQHDKMREALEEAIGNEYAPSQLVFQMSYTSLDDLMIEVGPDSRNLVANAQRPKSFLGIKILEDDKFEGWELVGKQPK